ncbi:Metal-dependent hydrolase YbeY [Fulvivirga imtechensis AK7]|uniref:Endoribonuclease YbeY n=1 Tax=Fulvivirga imtechensis AK7 TaxID=1237149 RepID=L8JNX8_9BACT|nr:rRNA maturation RNase YbeY [Fulvivirga imtechensis]ELR70666.1 Metal-dependent hydrolase YbeY [Fulvivirga imtechensis AK7]
MTSINFFQEEIEFDLANKRAIASWVKQVIKAEKCRLKELNYIFCSDEYLYKMNVEHLDHNTFTDIITFDNSEAAEQIEGDIFISIDRVKDNASNLNLPFEEELHRVMIHGVLHLIGYGDKTENEKTQMRKKEEACLSLRQ